MNDDYGWMAGAGIGIFLLMAAMYLGLLALSIWITYLIIRTAVKNGILKADEERVRRGYGVAAQAPRAGYQNPPQFPGAPPAQH